MNRLTDVLGLALAIDELLVQNKAMKQSLKLIRKEINNIDRDATAYDAMVGTQWERVLPDYNEMVGTQLEEPIDDRVGRG